MDKKNKAKKKVDTPAVTVSGRPRQRGPSNWRERQATFAKAKWHKAPARKVAEKKKVEEDDISE